MCSKVNPNGFLDWKKHFSSVLGTAILSILQISFYLHSLLQHLFQKMDVFFWYFNLGLSPITITRFILGQFLTTKHNENETH